MSVTNVDDKNFKDLVSKDGIVLIDFWAPWCGPCKAFGPVFEKVAEENSDATFAKCNTEDQPALSGALGIRSIPTLMVFRDGVMLYNQPGMLPEPALKEVVDKVRELDMDAVKKEIAEQQATQPAAEA